MLSIFILVFFYYLIQHERKSIIAVPTMAISKY